MNSNSLPPQEDNIPALAQTPSQLQGYGQGQRPDCLGCRITGTLTGLGLCGYLLFERSKVKLPAHLPSAEASHADQVSRERAFQNALRKASRHRNVLAVLAAVFGAVGVWRGLLFRPPGHGTFNHKA
ncbi:hypothetical protein BASA50_009056 [Batrachochytrium salamandrivorans]|uniref:DUF4536 domain-containing protein n=1 Tax=Batrachochytrium salamandrivorans TaxID=1357716 RepID=A0ABQ8F5X3_9FUNG|nr:hypothetical protein BASA62_009588 [Batrachochytrium salamandrivorans]KAH6570468.1 hypothetical protein BASA60_007676 [Batrachochytrium salamandrivorans]KAH6578492.1 hypothetical protein BASA61_000250 [Batrachochytrium salamandrivorans]KAH6591056.1 hypothetical protein BASA50_009056 [Batrachochytrium salamandrivorans]KAH9254285.1 hypothetical protein BASA81_007675 [Batrachochytrium salamandrivorans]